MGGEEDMHEEKAVVKILRQKPGGSGSAAGENRYEEYRVPFVENKNVLQVLTDIYLEQDRSLSFRRGRCNRGVCGACTMIINGKVGRACITAMTREMTLEPVGKYGVIKDLVAHFHHENPME